MGWNWAFPLTTAPHIRGCGIYLVSVSQINSRLSSIGLFPRGVSHPTVIDSPPLIRSPFSEVYSTSPIKAVVPPHFSLQEGNGPTSSSGVYPLTNPLRDRPPDLNNQHCFQVSPLCLMIPCVPPILLKALALMRDTPWFSPFPSTPVLPHGTVSNVPPRYAPSFVALDKDILWTIRPQFIYFYITSNFLFDPMSRPAVVLFQ